MVDNFHDDYKAYNIEMAGIEAAQSKPAKRTANQYVKSHIWIRKKYAKAGECEKCGAVCKTDWSNKSGEYKRERSDWQEFCRHCHREYDKQLHMKKASVRAGHMPALVIYGLKPEIANVFNRNAKSMKLKRYKLFGHLLRLYEATHREELSDLIL